MKSWIRFLLAVLVSMAVVSTAHANIIWKSSTSGQNPAAETELLKFFVDNKVVVNANVDTAAISNVAYDKALGDGCFNGISELSTPIFLNAFQAEWKAGFRKKYRLTASTVSWETFKQVGRQYGGFEVCNQAENKVFIQVVKDRQEVKSLQNQAQQLADKPMAPADQAKIDALAAMAKDLESKISGNTAAIGTHDKLILGLRTDVDNATALANKANEAVAGLTVEFQELKGGLTTVQEATEGNTRTINTLIGLPEDVAEVDKKAMAALGILIPEGAKPLQQQVKENKEALGDKVGSDDLWKWGIGIGVIALIAIFLAYTGHRRMNSYEQPPLMTRISPAKGGAGLGGGKSQSPPPPPAPTPQAPPKTT